MKGLEDNLIKVLFHLISYPHFVPICTNYFFPAVGRVRDAPSVLWSGRQNFQCGVGGHRVGRNDADVCNAWLCHWHLTKSFSGQNAAEVVILSLVFWDAHGAKCSSLRWRPLR